MGIITSLKTQAFRAIDWLDQRSDPWDEFTRPANPKYPESLETKAVKFEADMVQNFFWPDLGIFNYCIPQDDRLPRYVLGDQALHHGLATAMYAFKYSVTGMAGDAEMLYKCVSVGLKLQQPFGILIRGIAHKEEIKEDASYDQASGHLAGLYFSRKYGDGNVRVWSKSLCDIWAKQIVSSGYRLTNLDGTTTQFGKLINGPLTEPSSLTLTLAILRLAGRPEYQGLLDQYRSMIPYAYTRMASWVGKDYDLHRAAIHLHILNDLDPQPEYAAGLQRLWSMSRKSGNVWVQFLTGHVDVEMCKKVLSEFTLEDKQYDTLKINTSPYGRTLWDGQWCSKQPLPAWQKSGVDFWWQRNPYTMDGGGNPPSSRYHMGDWLLAYWALKSGKYI